MLMFSWLKISQHKHSGTLRPHEHTSYLPLGILLAFVGFVLAAYTVQAASPGPEAGSIGLSGVVPGKPPASGATITSPTNNQRFTTSPVPVSGTCLSGTLVELFKNNIFAGSTICNSTGNFSLEIDLLIGQNILVARVYDSLNQSGPDSNPVVVFYDALPPQLGPLSSYDFGSSQLLLNTDAVFRGIFPKQEMLMPLEILGGNPPYAVNVQWGDATNKVVPRNDNIGFTIPHMYNKAGIYQINIQATDAAGRVAFLTVAAIVNGQPDPATAAASSQTGHMNKLLALWPLYTASVAVVISFWLGERREKHLLARRGQLVIQS